MILQKKILIIISIQIFIVNFVFADYIIDCDNYKFSSVHSDTTRLNEALSLLEYDKSINDYSERIDLCKEFYCIAGRYNKLENQVLFLNEIGYCYYAIGEQEKVVEILNKTLQISIKIGYNEGEADVYNIFGLMYSELGISTSAYTYQRKLLNLGQRVDNKRWQADSKVNIGVILRNAGNYTQAEKYFLEAFDIYTKYLPEVSGNNWVRLHLGKLYELLNEEELAFKYYKEVENLMKDKNQLSGLMGLYNILGEYYLEKDDSQAKEYFEKTIKIGKQVAFKKIIVNANIGLGLYYFNKKEYGTARIKFTNALEAAAKSRFHEEVSTSADYLSKTYEYGLDYENAVKYKNIANDTRKKLEDREAKIIRNWLQSQELIDKKSEENRELENENKLNNEVIFRQQILGIFSIIIIFLLTYFVYNYYSILSERKKNNEQLRNLNKSISEKSSKLELANEQIQSQKKQLELDLTKKMLVLNLKENSLSEAFQIVESAKIEDYSVKRKLLSLLRNGRDELIREELDFQFNQTNSNLFEKLSQSYPDLSKADLRLCAFLKLNMSSKDISELTFKKEGSIKMARHRLRKKLGLANSNINLTTFLNSLIID